MKIVIVEDEVVIREGLEKLLCRMNKEDTVVAAVEDGEEGLRAILAHRPDMVITDIKMPKLDGLAMLEKLQESGLRPQTIVLSAYSEFSYAQRAVKLGVQEYLLKPIEREGLERSVEKIRALCARKSAEAMILNESMTSLLTRAIHSSETPAPRILQEIGARFDLNTDEPIVETAFFLGNDYEMQAATLQKRVSALFAQRTELKTILLPIASNKLLLALCFGCTDRPHFCRWLENCVRTLRATNDHVNCGFAVAGGMSALPDTFRTLVAELDWNIACPDTLVIMAEEKQKKQVEAYDYPRDLESGVKTAMCAYDAPRVQRLMEQFLSVQPQKEGACFSPKDVKEGYVRFLWSAIGTAKELSVPGAGEIRQQQLLERIMLARDSADLERLLRETMQGLLPVNKTENAALSLLVKKAATLIQENYASGITLEELAQRLHVTPEYLGTQFHKETGTTFGMYIRETRVDKAKKLLIGTQKKLYEIAQTVGYSDPKYFGRVFREATGCTPAEYRNLHK